MPVSEPFATPRRVFGTVMRKLKSALSVGWSLHGKTVCAALGWGQMAKPSGVGTQAVYASVLAGSAPYSTQTATAQDFGRVRTGVIRSFSSTCSKPHGHASDLHRAHVQAERVEREAREVLGRLDPQGRLGVDQAGRGVVREVEVVRLDAVAVVAEGRVDGVTEGLGTRGALVRP